MSKKDELATKNDVEEIVGRVVGEIVSDALQLISERFEKQDGVLAQHSGTLAEHSATLNRVENKLNATVDLVDEHSQQIKQLKVKIV